MGISSEALSGDSSRNSFCRLFQKCHLGGIPGICRLLQEYLLRIPPRTSVGHFFKSFFWGLPQEFLLSINPEMPPGNSFSNSIRGLLQESFLRICSRDISIKPFCEFLLIPSWISSVDTSKNTWKLF